MNTQNLTVEQQLADEQHVEGLIKNLDQQIDLFDQSIDLGLRQRQALVNNKLEENKEINIQQEENAFQLEQLEKERLKLTGNIFDAAGPGGVTGRQEPSTIKCKDLYPFMSQDHAERLEELKQILKKKIGNMKRLNETNAILIQNSRNIIQATMGIITGLAAKEEREKSRTYGSGGKINRYQKQKVNFFNKQV